MSDEISGKDDRNAVRRGQVKADQSYVDALVSANAAGVEAYRQVIADEGFDSGPAGGSLIEVRRGSKLANAAIASGFGYDLGDSVSLKVKLPAGEPWAQAANPNQAAAAAMVASLRCAGFDGIRVLDFID